MSSHKYQTRKEEELSIFEYIETFYNYFSKIFQIFENKFKTNK